MVAGPPLVQSENVDLVPVHEGRVQQDAAVVGRGDGPGPLPTGNRVHLREGERGTGRIGEEIGQARAVTREGCLEEGPGRPPRTQRRRPPGDRQTRELLPQAPHLGDSQGVHGIGRPVAPRVEADAASIGLHAVRDPP